MHYCPVVCIDLHARAGGTRLTIPCAARMIDERSDFAIVDSHYDASPGAVLVTAWPIAYQAHIRKPASKKKIRQCAWYTSIYLPATKIALRYVIFIPRICIRCTRNPGWDTSVGLCPFCAVQILHRGHDGPTRLLRVTADFTNVVGLHHDSISNGGDGDETTVPDKWSVENEIGHCRPWTARKRTGWVNTPRREMLPQFVYGRFLNVTLMSKRYHIEWQSPIVISVMNIETLFALVKYR